MTHEDAWAQLEPAVEEYRKAYRALAEWKVGQEQRRAQVIAAMGEREYLGDRQEAALTLSLHDHLKRGAELETELQYRHMRLAVLSDLLRHGITE